MSKQFLRVTRTAGWYSLIHNIIIQALLDLNSKDERLKWNAKRFLQSDICEWYCLAIDLNYNNIKNIDFDNPDKTLDYSFSAFKS